MKNGFFQKRKITFLGSVISHKRIFFYSVKLPEKSLDYRFQDPFTYTLVNLNQFY